MAAKIQYTHILGFVEDKDTQAKMSEVLAKKPHTRIINFYSKILEDLLLAAKYRAVDRPTMIVLNGDRVVARLCRIPDDTILTNLEPILG